MSDQSLSRWQSDLAGGPLVKLRIFTLEAADIRTIVHCSQLFEVSARLRSKLLGKADLPFLVLYSSQHEKFIGAYSQSFSVKNAHGSFT